MDQLPDGDNASPFSKNRDYVALQFCMIKDFFSSSPTMTRDRDCDHEEDKQELESFQKCVLNQINTCLIANDCLV